MKLAPACRAPLLLALLGTLHGACASTPATPERTELAADGRPSNETPEAPVLVVDNPTSDSWDLVVDGSPRGSVSPGTSTRLLSLPAGLVTLVVSNDRIGLMQSFRPTLRDGETATVVIASQLTRLEVDNPADEPVEVRVDGVLLGLAAARGVTAFEGVPAGRRTLQLKGTVGPGSVRMEQVLPTGTVARLAVPPLSDAPPHRDLPRPPDGMGLVRMRNLSRLAVTVLADGADQGLVAAGGVLDIVLTPGTHRLEVRLEGLRAHTEHSVTLGANQSAEWVWGEP